MVNKKSGAARRKAQQARTAAAPPTSSSSSGPSSPVATPASNGTTNGTVAEEDKMDIDQEQPTTVEPTAVEQAEKAKEQGNLAFKAGKHSEAVRHYTTATDLVSSTNPEAAAPYYANRAAASMSLKLYPSALSDMQSSLALSPPPPPPKNLLRLARCQLATAQTGPARSTLTPLLSTPLAPDATKELARVDAVESSVSSIQAARSRDDPSMVLIGLDRLSRFSDGGLSASTEWTCWRIEALLAKSRLNEASDAVTALLRSSGGDKNPEAWWWRGLVLFHQANLSQSVKAFQESLRLDPDLTKSRTMMRFVKKLEGLKEDGNKAFKAGDTDLAIEKYSSATSEPLPEAPGVGSKMPVAVRTTLLSNTSAALLKRRRAGDFDRALATADEIVALDPDHFKAWRTKGRARVALAKEGDENDGDGSSQQVRVQKWEDAVRDLEQAEDKAPNEEERAGLKKEIRDAKTELKKAKAKDYYKILGVSRTADDTEIKRAFKKQSLQHHPDKGGDEEKFKEINEAFSVLSDPQKRRMVDQGIDPNDPTAGHEGMGGFDMGGADGIPINLADLFGGGGGGGFRFASAGGSPFGGGMGGSPFGGMGGSPFGAAGGSRGGGGSPFGFQF